MIGMNGGEIGMSIFCSSASVRDDLSPWRCLRPCLWPRPCASLRLLPSPSARPKEKLRDCRLEQVSRRSPRPERPVSVSGLRTQRLAEARQFGEGARGERGPRTVAQALAVGDAAGDGQHILDRAADRDAAQIIGRIDAESRRLKRCAHCLASLRSGARQRHRGRQAARHIGAKLGPERTRPGPCGRHRAQDSVMKRPLSRLDALGAQDDGSR